MRILLFLVLALLPLAAAPNTASPWTRWWWLGSGVDEANLTRQLEAFAAAGIGGVEICPIYGAKGYEDRDLDFLSPRWTAMLAHTARECQRLGLGLDLTTGTGWPFGGPWVTGAQASHSLVPVRTNADAGALRLKLPAGTPACLRAFPAHGEAIDLLPMVRDGVLEWMVPSDGCRIRGIVTKSPIQKVKRAAPGGAGNVVDPFSPASLRAYLARFDVPLDTLGAPAPRAHFHDSFEYYGADWTPGLLETFRQRNGYDLRDHLPAFLGEGDPDTVARVACDYRSTLDFLHRSYLETWNAWAKEHGSLTRNQAHGSPGNLLDHYAVADIPETEIFRHVDEGQIPMLQFAASAAHLTGKPLVSAESFTWLGEHFQVRPAALKEAADFLWLGGVNHLFFHGIPYSPADARWPGWLFYASTHMGENGGLWRDLPAFNDYIRTVQTELQSGRADTAVLLYFPVHDRWSEPSPKLPLFTLHNQNEWLHPTPFYDAAITLWQQGIPCDFISDRLLEKATVEDGELRVGATPFRALVIPKAHTLPESTAARIRELAAQGARVAFLATPPRTTPGLPAKPLDFPASIPRSVDLLAYLGSVGIRPEPMSALGLRFVRRVTADGHSWFVVNRSGKPLDAWIPLSTPFTSALFVDPADPRRSGNPAIRAGKLRFLLDPGESRLLRTFTTHKVDALPWSERKAIGEPIGIEGPWKVEFLDGGPELPAARTMERLASWAANGGSDRPFCGTARYSTHFEADAGHRLLDLGQVAETCRVTLNGKPLGISFFPPHRFEVTTALSTGRNTLVVEVTNLAANRIADLDRRGVEWKAFHEINFVNIDYQPFDASGWEPLPSGLLGPVRLLPLPPR